MKSCLQNLLFIFSLIPNLFINLKAEGYTFDFDSVSTSSKI